MFSKHHDNGTLTLPIHKLNEIKNKTAQRTTKPLLKVHSPLKFFKLKMKIGQTNVASELPVKRNQAISEGDVKLTTDDRDRRKDHEARDNGTRVARHSAQEQHVRFENENVQLCPLFTGRILVYRGERVETRRVRVRGRPTAMFKGGRRLRRRRINADALETSKARKINIHGSEGRVPFVQRERLTSKFLRIRVTSRKQKVRRHGIDDPSQQQRNRAYNR